MLALAQSNFLISELMYDPQGADDGQEWFELINLSGSVVRIEGGRKGWRVNDGQSHLFENISLSLFPNQTLIVVQDKNKFLAAYPDFKTNLIEANFNLKNKAGQILIEDSQKNILAQTSYQNNAGAAGNGRTLVWQNNQWREGAVLGGQPGLYPDSVKPPTQTGQTKPAQTKSVNLDRTSQTSSPIQIQSQSNLNPTELKTNSNSDRIFSAQNLNSSDKISAAKKLEASIESGLNNAVEADKNNFNYDNLWINEFLPNPTGSDQGREFIELYNSSTEAIDLSQLFLNVGDKKIKLSGWIEPRSYFVLNQSDYKFSIKNTGDRIGLFDRQAKLIFEISYTGSAPTGRSLSRFNQGGWIWTTPSPASKNTLADRADQSLGRKENLNQTSSTVLVQKATGSSAIKQFDNLNQVRGKTTLLPLVFGSIVALISVFVTIFIFK